MEKYSTNSILVKALTDNAQRFLLMNIQYVILFGWDYSCETDRNF